MASEIRNRFTDTEMQIARETDLPELLSHLGYQVKRVGRFHTTAEMDSLRIKPATRPPTNTATLPMRPPKP